MSVYVPKYRHDIFVSYAYVDNEAFAGANKGWVTTLINTLKIFLAQKLGRPDAYSLWMGEMLPGYASVTPEILQHLENSAILLLVLSPGYLASPQCRLELDAFLAKTGQDGRIFIVEYQQVDRPETLSDLPGYRFWEADSIRSRSRTLGIPKLSPDQEIQYHQKVEDIAIDLVDKLKQLKVSADSNQDYVRDTNVVLSGSENQPKTTIFLAEVSDDLIFRRDELKRDLELQGIEVLPEKPYYFNSDAELQQVIDNDIKKAALFVQILSDISPQRPPGMSTPLLQYERARKLGELPILQWRDRNLKINEITDFTYRSLLTGSTVMAVGMVEFKQYIMQSLKKFKEEDKRKVSPHISNKLVFINAESQAMPLAHQVANILTTHRLSWSLPSEFSENTSPEQMRQDLEENLLDCHAVIVVYDSDTPVTWVRQQLRHCNRISSKRGHEIKVIAVYDKPSSTTKPLTNMNLPNMWIFQCPTPQADTCLPHFMQVLQT